MATTTPNFGWPVPTSTDLVKDGATAIEALGDGIDASLLDLKGGTSGQVLKKNSNTDMDFVWGTDSAGMTNPMTTTGDTIYSSSGSTPARLGIGTTGQVLTVASGVPSWATPAAGGGSALTYLGATTFTSAATTSIDNVFTSTYQNYLVMLNIYSGGGALTMNFRASGADNTTANYNFYTDYMAFGSSWSRSITNTSNGTAMTLNGGMDSSNVNLPLTIQNPQIAQKTQVSSSMTSYNYNASQNYTGLNTGFFNSTTQFDGIKFSAGTNMTGTLKIYGYANS
jgi:hypothetical protein